MCFGGTGSFSGGRKRRVLIRPARHAHSMHFSTHVRAKTNPCDTRIAYRRAQQQTQTPAYTQHIAYDLSCMYNITSKPSHARDHRRKPAFRANNNRTAKAMLLQCITRFGMGVACALAAKTNVYCIVVMPLDWFTDVFQNISIAMTARQSHTQSLHDCKHASKCETNHYCQTSVSWLNHAYHNRFDDMPNKSIMPRFR